MLGSDTSMTKRRYLPCGKNYTRLAEGMRVLIKYEILQPIRRLPQMLPSMPCFRRRNGSVAPSSPAFR